MKGGGMKFGSSHDNASIYSVSGLFTLNFLKRPRRTSGCLICAVPHVYVPNAREGAFRRPPFLLRDPLGFCLPRASDTPCDSRKIPDCPLLFVNPFLAFSKTLHNHIVSDYPIKINPNAVTEHDRRRQKKTCAAHKK
jgi:hypothetical protein